MILLICINMDVNVNDMFPIIRANTKYLCLIFKQLGLGFHDIIDRCEKYQCF